MTSSIQTTIPFSVRKRCSFYGSKRATLKEDFTDATVRSSSTVSKYTPTVRKIVTLSSSSSESESDSESDVENTFKEHNAHIGRRKGSSIPTGGRTRKSCDTNGDNGSTPPKQKRIGEMSVDSPSTLLDRLNLASSLEKEEKLLPKKLFTTDRYGDARKALHGSTSDSLPGREKELAELEAFIRDNLLSQSSASLYVSGPPGTGKTACLSNIMRKEEFESRFKMIYVNCTTMKSAAAIYSKIIRELGIHVTGKPGKKVIEKYLLSDHKMLLLILDEVDQLQSKQQSVLYSIFEWPSKPNSKLILVGIANSLDLTDRMLPRLRAKCELKPKLMHFSPYDKQQIFGIISTRLLEANVADVFTETALQMLAGKVAAVSGDIRRALDISRRLVEIAESHKMTHVLRPSANYDSKKQQSTDKPVDLKDVVSVINGVYSGSQSFRKEDSTFPLQQKLLLCSYLLILNKGRNKDVTIGKLHEVYKKVCEKRNIHAVDVSEFVSLCSLIETRGVLRIIGKREQPRLSKISLQWDQEELDAALQDKNMMTEIMNDVTCL